MARNGKTGSTIQTASSSSRPNSLVARMAPYVARHQITSKS